MKKLFLALGLLALTSASFAADIVSRSFLAPGVTYIQLTNTVNVTNLTSTGKFGTSAITNKAGVMWNVASQPSILYLTTTTNPVSGYNVTRHLYTDVVSFGNGVLTNVDQQYTMYVGTNTPISSFLGNSTNITTTYVLPTSANDFNLLSTVPLPTDVNHTMMNYPGDSFTNSWGTISITMKSTGSNTCIFVFTVVPDGSNESTVSTDSFAVTVTGASGTVTQTYQVPMSWPGARALKLQSITPAGSGPMGILAVNLNTTSP